MLQQLLSFEVYITKPYRSRHAWRPPRQSTQAPRIAGSARCGGGRKHGEGSRTACDVRARSLEIYFRHGAHAWRVSLRSQLQRRQADASLDECAAIRRRPDAFGAAIEERHAKRALHVGNRSRDCGLGHRKLCGCLRHASGLRHSEQNLQFMELESIDAVVAMHDATYTV